MAENSEFSARCEEAGVVFIGPTPDVIENLGTKTSARDIAISAGVPVVPGMCNPHSFSGTRIPIVCCIGSEGECKSADEAIVFGEKHGFPILFKAAYGGGGRGIRIVHSVDEIASAFERSTSEARAAFGNGTEFSNLDMYRTCFHLWHLTFRNRLH